MVDDERDGWVSVHGDEGIDLRAIGLGSVICVGLKEFGCCPGYGLRVEFVLDRNLVDGRLFDTNPAVVGGDLVYVIGIEVGGWREIYG